MGGRGEKNPGRKASVYSETATWYENAQRSRVESLALRGGRHAERGVRTVSDLLRRGGARAGMCCVVFVLLRCVCLLVAGSLCTRSSEYIERPVFFYFVEAGR